MTHILDLPIEKQKESADKLGMSLEDFVGMMKKSRKRIDQFKEDEKHFPKSRMTPEQEELYRRRLLSENGVFED